MEPELSEFDMRRGCRLGVDSHSDTTVVGKHAKITAIIEGQTVEAFPFAKSFGSIKDLPIVNKAVTYDHPTLCRTFILHMNHSIFIGEDSDHCLLSPNQVRANGIKVDDGSVHYEPSSSYSIYVPKFDLHLPFKSHGPTAYLQIRHPTEEEYEECDHMHLTDPEGWDPYGVHSSSTCSTKISQDFRVYPPDAQLMQNSFISKIIATPIINSKSLTHSIR